MCVSVFSFSYNGGRSAEDIIKFINDKANTRIGQGNSTDSNFNSVVIDESKNVLVEFYAPCEYSNLATLSLQVYFSLPPSL